ncbi:MAG: branched-chain amino acid ABC transporter permease [Candidatus Binatia bacterium]
MSRAVAPARRRLLLAATVLAGAALAFAIPGLGLVNQYVQFILITIGINVILSLSLNLVNGFMGEFSVGHPGFMAVGAYIAAMGTSRWFDGPPELVFPFAVVLGGLGAALLGLVIGAVSFKTSGDYLAIVTLAFLMIVKSALENIDAVGGPRGLLGIAPLTTLPWTFAWVAVTVWVIRNLVYSRFGRGITAVREDAVAAGLVGVHTRQVKVLAFVVSAFFTGVAGGLFAHLLQFINPRMFDIIKSTEMLVMVYLGGIGSIAGSILGAVVFTVLMELLRPLAAWRMVVMPLLLVLLMLFRPRGIMGLREIGWLQPSEERPAPPPHPA